MLTSIIAISVIISIIMAGYTMYSCSNAEREYNGTARKVTYLILEQRLAIEKHQERKKIFEQLDNLNTKFHKKVTPLQLWMITNKQHNNLSWELLQNELNIPMEQLLLYGCIRMDRGLFTTEEIMEMK